MYRYAYFIGSFAYMYVQLFFDKTGSFYPIKWLMKTDQDGSL